MLQLNDIVFLSKLTMRHFSNTKTCIYVYLQNGTFIKTFLMSGWRARNVTYIWRYSLFTGQFWHNLTCGRRPFYSMDGNIRLVFGYVSLRYFIFGIDKLVSVSGKSFKMIEIWNILEAIAWCVFLIDQEILTSWVAILRMYSIN